MDTALLSALDTRDRDKFEQAINALQALLNLLASLIRRLI